MAARDFPLQLASAKDFMALLQEQCVVAMNKGQDVDRRDYVSVEVLFMSFGQAGDVTEWLALEYAPHEPAIVGHYYCGGAA